MHDSRVLQLRGRKPLPLRSGRFPVSSYECEKLGVMHLNRKVRKGREGKQRRILCALRAFAVKLVPLHNCITA